MDQFDRIIQENARDYNEWINTLNNFAAALERIGYKTTIRWNDYGACESFPIRSITEQDLEECWDLSVTGANDEGPRVWTWLRHDPAPDEIDRFWCGDIEQHGTLAEVLSDFLRKHRTIFREGAE